MYNDAEEGGVAMTVREVVRTLWIKRKVSLAKIGEKVGWSRQSISQKLANESFRVDDLILFADACGCEIAFRVKDTGEFFRVVRRGHGRKVNAVYDWVRYRTDRANALANNFYLDGVNEFNPDGTAVEYYEDTEGRFFRVMYYRDDPDKYTLSTVSKDEADAFIAKYGTVLERKKGAESSPADADEDEGGDEDD